MGRDVARYLLTRSDRDLRTLLATLDRLDRSSLERHRPLTIALLREVLRDG
jgi:DnaA family protein